MTSGSSFLALDPRTAWGEPQTTVAAQTAKGFTLYRPLNAMMLDDLTARTNALFKVASIK
jgi:hypothetical protein